MSEQRIELLAIGDELLDGRVTDTNAVRLARALAECGATLAERVTIPDDIEVIVRAAGAIAARGTTLCVVSGGLGPTADDLTAEAFSKLAGVAQVRDAEQAQRIERFLVSRGRNVTPNQLKQADRPAGSQVIANRRGTAPGFAITVGGCRFVSVPGVPHEFDAMVESEVVAPLRAAAPPRLRRALQTFGFIEAEVDARVAEIATRWPAVRLGFRVKFPEIEVTLSAAAADEPALAAALAFARERLGAAAFGEGDASFGATVVEHLRAAQATVAVGESCTGGLITDLLTDVPGASDVLLGGVVAYANAVKEKLLGVRAGTLVQHGAVSEAVAREMAAGARARAGSTYGIGVTGIAGPGGGTPDKPVGTVHLAVCGPGLEEARSLTLPFDRRWNKVVSAYSALDLLRRSLVAHASR